MIASKQQKVAARRGQVILAGDHYKARIRYTDGSRRFIHLPPGLSEDEAKERAARLAKKAIAEGWTGDRQGPAATVERHGDLSTVVAWFDAYLDFKQSRSQTVSAPTSHVRNWILPALGDKRMEAVTPDDLRKFVTLLDRAVSLDEIRWKTATNIWGTVTKAFKDAANSKNDHLRILPANPALGIPPPDKGRETKKVHLFPSEFLSLMNCDAVPLPRRRAYAVSVYLYLRPGELEALDWQDFDLAHQQVTIQRSMDRELGGYKAPKNGMARLPMSIERRVMPLIVAMHREAGGVGQVFGEAAGSRDAQNLRDDLLLAGVTRHELHNASKTPPREWMTLHDLRTTGITWMAVRGDDLLLVKARAGHSDSKMTEHYISLAAMMRKQDYGEPFPPLPRAVVGSSAPEQAARPYTFDPGQEGTVSRVVH